MRKSTPTPMYQTKIIKYLVQKGTDSRDRDETYLMAAIRDNRHLAMNLLEKGGEDTNICNSKEENALHYCAKYNRLEVVHRLLELNANYTRNKEGLTPVLIAAYKGHFRIIDAFTKCDNLSRQDKIQALEIMGTHGFNPAEPNSHWKRSLRERYDEEKEEIISDKEDSFLADCMEDKEFVTENELFEMNSFKYRMQCLFILVRYFKPHYKYLFRSIVPILNCFYGLQNFSICFHVLTHVLTLQERESNPTEKAFLDIVAFCNKLTDRMVGLLAKNNKVIGRPDDMLVVNDRIVQEMLRLFKKNIEIYRVLQSYLVLLDSYCLLEDIFDANQKLQLRDTVKELITYNPRLYKYPNVLYGAYYSRCFSAVRLFLELNFPMDCLDDYKRSPLHLAVQSKNLDLISTTLSTDVHRDIRDSWGLTAYERAKEAGLKHLFPQEVPSLQCLSARMIVLFRVDYRAKIPPVLYKFIDVH